MIRIREKNISNYELKFPSWEEWGKIINIVNELITLWFIIS